MQIADTLYLIPINSNIQYIHMYAGNMNFLMFANCSCPQLRFFYFGYFHHVLMLYARVMWPQANIQLKLLIWHTFGKKNSYCLENKHAL